VQGSIDGVDFLVTCPVDRWSAAVAWRVQERDDSLAREGREGREGQEDQEVQETVGLRRLWNSSNGLVRRHRLSLPAPAGAGSNAGYEKAGEALRRAGNLGSGGPGFGSGPRPQPVAGLAVDLWSEIQVGKGMASSTADLVAVAAAAAAALEADLSPEGLFQLALSIEPSDAVMLPGITLADHLGGGVTRFLGEPPGLEVLVVDPGGALDTRSFNQIPGLQELNAKKEPQVRAALEMVETGIRQADAVLVGKGATLSAQAHQDLVANPIFDRAHSVAAKLGAVGVNVAHSGTVVGILFDPRERPAAEMLPLARREMPGVGLEVCRVISGGVRRL